MKIEIDITDEEAEFYCIGCILRVTKHAADLLENPTSDYEEDPDAPWTASELRKIGQVTEQTRKKIVNAVFLARLERMK